MNNESAEEDENIAASFAHIMRPKDWEARWQNNNQEVLLHFSLCWCLADIVRRKMVQATSLRVEQPLAWVEQPLSGPALN